MKENIKSMLNCIRGIREELAKANIESNDVNNMERLATATQYENFYSDVLEDLDDEE